LGGGAATRREMKQTTIGIRMEEDVCGEVVRPLPRHGGQLSAAERRAWELIAPSSVGGNPIVSNGLKSGEECRKLAERVGRVIANRRRKTRARVVRRATAGYAVEWRVTVFWDRPNPAFKKKPDGQWTIYDRGGRVVCRVDASLDCDGDALYSHLPEGDVPDGWEVYPDIGDILVVPDCGTDRGYLLKWRQRRYPDRRVS